MLMFQLPDLLLPLPPESQLLGRESLHVVNSQANVALYTLTAYAKP